MIGGLKPLPACTLTDGSGLLSNRKEAANPGIGWTVKMLDKTGGNTMVEGEGNVTVAANLYFPKVFTVSWEKVTSPLTGYNCTFDESVPAICN
jgi:hypothetical protein